MINTFGVYNVGDVASIAAAVDILSIDSELVVVSTAERCHVHCTEARMSNADPAAHGQFAFLNDVIGNSTTAIPCGWLPRQRQRVAANMVGVG